MIKLSQMKGLAKVVSPPTEDDLTIDAEAPATMKEGETFEPDEDEEREHLLEAFDWLKRCMHLLAFMADTKSIPKVTIRERAAMERLSDGIDSFLDDVEHLYEDYEEPTTEEKK